MRKGITAVLLAAGLAGCGGVPVEHRNYREIGPGEGVFGDTFTWEWRRKDSIPAETQPAAAPATPAQASAAEQAEFMKWRENAGRTERQEFEEWRAWQEWKRRNPK